MYRIYMYTPEFRALIMAVFNETKAPKENDVKSNNFSYDIYEIYLTKEFIMKERRERRKREGGEKKFTV